MMTMLDAPTGEPVADPLDWSWRITWRGRSWTDADLTAQHVGILALLSGGDEWANLNIDEALTAAKAEVVDGPLRLVNMLAAFVICAEVPDGLPEDVAQERTTIALNRVRKASMVDVIDAFTVKA